MSVHTLVLILLVVILLGALPTWPYSQAWGPYPAGLIVVLIVVLLLFRAMG